MRQTHSQLRFRPGFRASLQLCFILLLALGTAATAGVVSDSQSRIVKIYGAGGLRGLESYQSGFLISAEGHILTSFSYVLDTEEVTATLDDGRDFTAKLIGLDPRLELAILKIEATDLPFFDVEKSVKLKPGSRVLAFSNLFGIATGDEPASVMHGSVMAISKLSARRGNFQIPYQGEVYIVDAITNNPGAAGGALTNSRGELAAVLGKELRSADANVWINYALPIGAIRDSISAMKEGKSLPEEDEANANLAKSPWTPGNIGVLFVPDVLERTPPFVEAVTGASSAEKAGILPDDLVMYVGTTLVRSYRDLIKELRKIEDQDDLQLTILRDKKLIPMKLEADPNADDLELRDAAAAAVKDNSGDDGE